MYKTAAISDFELYNKVKQCLKEKDIELQYVDIDELKLNCKKHDLAIFYDEYEYIKSTKDDNVLNIQPSLLPAYPHKNAIATAFNDGVKVSGITIHTKDKIIAQYPVLIGINTHIEEYINELHNIKNILLPSVIESILYDRVFDFADLFNNPCNKGGCSGCGRCH